MVDVKFYNSIDINKLSFAVIIARMGGKWVLCKHKERTTYELPGGHREKGETIYETARRELREETGALNFSLDRVCDYSLRGITHFGEKINEEIFGTLYCAQIETRNDVLHSKIESVIHVDKLPDNLTYPVITAKLVERASKKIRQCENGTAYILVYDGDLNKYPAGCDPFVKRLLADGFTVHDVYHGVWDHCPTVYVNLNSKIIAFGMPGLRCFEHLGHHAITIEEFETIYSIFKKYEGKAPLVFE